MTAFANALSDLLDHARRAGADAAHAVVSAGEQLSVQRRLGRTEHLERAESRDLTLKVYLGTAGAYRVASVDATAIDPRQFATLAERAVAMARVVPVDPYAGLAEETASGDLEAAQAALDLDDGSRVGETALTDRAAAAEEALRAVEGVTNSEGASAGWSRFELAVATSAGFSAHVIRSSHSVSASALAGTGTDMQRDGEYTFAAHLDDLDDPVAVGRLAGERAVSRLYPIRPRTGPRPVVFDPRVAASILGHLSGAINGASVARGTSFLREKLGQRIMPEGVFVMDEPHRRRGPRSRPFDAEGVATRDRALVEDGVLTTWLLDSRSARQLGLRSTGHAAGGSAGPSNLYFRPGSMTPVALMADIADGIYVTELIGMGVNGLTGDYSRGAAGFMIRDGAIAEPVAEITIAGRLPEMFMHVTLASDLRFRRGTDAPTLRVDGLTIAGA